MSPAPLLAALDVDVVTDNTMSVIESKISGSGRDDKDDAFFVADLSDVVRKHKLWTQQLPRVHPYYAVKCNEDPGVLGTLAELGTGFDCASKAEIQKILAMKVPADRIIYANPCKQASHIKYAAKHSVARMTFDNEVELQKIKKIYPEAELVLRLRPDETKAQCQLGMKYGCGLKQVPHLLTVAKELNLNVIGVSFHVGSGCEEASAYSNAVALARLAFDLGREAGFAFSLLDIGGGFPGQESADISFHQICALLRPALDWHFPQGCGVDIIAEPGRFFVASAFTLVVNIIAKRAIARDKTDCKDVLSADDQPAFMYYVNDGVYGSFNCLLYDHATVSASVMPQFVGQLEYPSSVWGPTCDGLDCIASCVNLPELETGDWLVFRDMGAYTMCAASNFNGMPKPHCYYIVQEDLLFSNPSKRVAREMSQVLHHDEIPLRCT